MRGGGLRRFLSFGDRLERVLVRLVIGLALLVFLAQAALARPDLRRWLSFVDHLEGVSLATYSVPSLGGTPPAVPSVSPAVATEHLPGTAPVASLTLTLVGHKTAPWVTVLVNGDPAATFVTASAAVAVRPGDLVEIDPGKYRGAVTVKVAESRGVSYPTVGQSLTAQGTIARLGRVLPPVELPVPSGP